MHKGACAGVGEALMACLYPLCAEGTCAGSWESLCGYYCSISVGSLLGVSGVRF